MPKSSRPETAPLDAVTITVLKRAIERVSSQHGNQGGFTRVRRMCDVGEKTFQRALSGFAVMPLTRIKLTAFADKWHQEHE